MGKGSVEINIDRDIYRLNNRIYLYSIYIF